MPHSQRAIKWWTRGVRHRAIFYVVVIFAMLFSVSSSIPFFVDFFFICLSKKTVNCRYMYTKYMYFVFIIVFVFIPFCCHYAMCKFHSQSQFSKFVVSLSFLVVVACFYWHCCWLLFSLTYNGKCTKYKVHNQSQIGWKHLHVFVYIFTVSRWAHVCALFYIWTDWRVDCEKCATVVAVAANKKLNSTMKMNECEETAKESIEQKINFHLFYFFRCSGLCYLRAIVVVIIYCRHQWRQCLSCMQCFFLFVAILVSIF